MKTGRILHAKIFTDASVRQGQAGVATYIQIPGGPYDILQKVNIGAFTSSAAAELLAADLALRSAATLIGCGLFLGSVHIAPDFKEVCRIMETLCTSKFPEGRELRETAKHVTKTCSPTNFFSSHVKAHSNIEGNVNANRAAREAARGETSVELIKDGKLRLK